MAYIFANGYCILFLLQSSPLPETPDMITPYAEYRMGEDNHLIIDEPKPKVENHIYASVSKAQRESILSST